MSTPRSVLLATLALAVCAGPADAASAKHRKPKAKRPAAVKVVKKAAPVATPALAPTPAPAPAPAPVVNSVISIGGYAFYGLTYEQAVAAYEAAVAAAPAGYTPPPVTSVSVDVTVGQ